MGLGRSELRNGIPSPGAVPGSDRPDPPAADGSFQNAHNRTGCNPATAAVSSYADADSPARGLTFSAMTPNAVKRRRFRTKRDGVEIFLAAPTDSALAEGVSANWPKVTCIINHLSLGSFGTHKWSRKGKVDFCEQGQPKSVHTMIITESKKFVAKFQVDAK